MFCKQLAERSKFPPKLGALEEHIKHVRLNQVTKQPFEPLQFGYYMDANGQLLPFTTLFLPAPQVYPPLYLCSIDAECKNDDSLNIENNESALMVIRNNLNFELHIIIV